MALDNYDHTPIIALSCQPEYPLLLPIGNLEAEDKKASNGILNLHIRSLFQHTLLIVIIGILS